MISSKYRVDVGAFPRCLKLVDFRIDVRLANREY